MIRATQLQLLLQRAIACQWQCRCAAQLELPLEPQGQALLYRRFVYKLGTRCNLCACVVDTQHTATHSVRRGSGCTKESTLQSAPHFQHLPVKHCSVSYVDLKSHNAAIESLTQRPLQQLAWTVLKLQSSVAAVVVLPVTAASHKPGAKRVLALCVAMLLAVHTNVGRRFKWR